MAPVSPPLSDEEIEALQVSASLERAAAKRARMRRVFTPLEWAITALVHDALVARHAAILRGAA